jgi:RHS repeat-associated protein
MTSRAGSTVTWSSYNYPTNINANDATGAEEVQLSYGPDRQRWKQIYTAPGTTENTYYIGGLLEKVLSGSTTNYRHYIYAGREAVAVYSHTAAGVNTMSYMLEDHQGGVSNIASKSGTSDVNESFSAFGTRRNPTTWSGAPTTADLNTIAGLSRQGYTFQTWLGQSMGLNHMNGRVEDAILGRFLSPDPHITDPSNAQNYNRYSYVNNNPLTFTDMTGFDTDDNPGTGECWTGTTDDPHYFVCDPQEIPSPGTRDPDPSSPPPDTGPPLPSGPGSSSSSGGTTSQPNQPAQGHTYSTRNPICQRALTAPEISDLISRFTVPNVYLQGQPLGAGIHMVAAWGIPGGFVTTTFSADGLRGFNQTTPFHIFTGTVVRSIDNTGIGADMVTYGYGGYPSVLPTSPYSSSLTTSSIDLGAILDQINDALGPVVFNAVDQQAARFAQHHYPGC